MTKCTWVNQQHLRKLDGAALLAHAKPELEKASLQVTDDAVAIRALESVKEKVSLAGEFSAWTHFFFRDEFPMEDEAKAKLAAGPQNAALLRALGESLNGTAEWNDATIADAITATATAQKVKAGALMPLLRGSLSGQMRGPDVKVMMQILGRDKVLARINHAAAQLPA
jgi:glutamyl-tRNA synthetase